MKSIRTDPSNHAAEGDERIRTAGRSVATDSPYEIVSPEFGWYLAGIVDGEGCFYIARANGGRTLMCGFIVHLRADDRPLLEYLCEGTGLGGIYKGRREKVGTDQPSYRWGVTRKDECGRLIALFEQFPLKSKKRRDFILWAEAVRAWERQDYPYMEALKETLSRVREFSPLPADAELPASPQLELEVA